MFCFKILQMFLLPSVFLFVFALAGIFLFFKTKRKKIGKILLISGLIFFYIFSITPVADLILSPLENKYSQIEESELDKTDIIVLLLGGEESDILRVSEISRIYFLKDKQAEIIISGRDPIDENAEQGEKVKDFLIQRGVLEKDIVLENQSRNTFESAKNIKKMFDQDEFFLITSAYHIPRTMEIFKKMGTNPLPAPSDFKIQDNYDIFDFFPSARNLLKCDLVFHEYFGIIFYRLAY